MEAGFASGSQIQRSARNIGKMTAVVYKLRDYQNPKDLERMRQALEREAAQIMKEVAPYGGQGIDGMPYYAPEKDPA